VVEFYDPHCGACLAFASNYVEVAKKVHAVKPHVEFYGVSCKAHAKLCYEDFGAHRVPKILVFAEGTAVAEDGKEVPKGAGTIHFLSQRLLKALRSEEEIATDAENSSGRRQVERASRRRRMGEYVSAEELSMPLSSSTSGDVGSVEAQRPRQTDNGVDNEEEKASFIGPDEEEEAVYKNPPRQKNHDQIQFENRNHAWKEHMDEIMWHPKKDIHPKEGNTQERVRSTEKAALEETKYHPASPLPSRRVMPVGGDASDPNPLTNDPDRQKEFQAFVAKRREKLMRKEKLKHPIKTILRGKTEDIGKDMIDSSSGNTKIVPRADTAHNIESRKALPKRVPDLRPEAQQTTTGQKVLSKVPIVKRAFKRSKAEETLNDAALSFTRGILMGVFRNDPDKPLDYERKAALKDWLDLLSVSLPPEMGLHELIDTLRYNVDNVSQSVKNLEMIVSKHYIPNPQWSDSCTRTTNGKNFGFFCGFWKLLHIMSVGFAEQAGGLSLRESNPSIRVFSPSDAADVVRDYMTYFFNCDKCTSRFISQYDSCKFDRCNRLTDKIEDAPADSWKEFPLWLWAVHNDISRSKANRASEAYEKLGRKGQARKWENDMKAVYPHIDQCISCFAADGTWDEDSVYNHLEKEYWIFGHDVNEKVDEFLEYREKPHYGVGTYLCLAIGGLITTWLVRKRKLRISGRHKKEDVLSDRFSQGKYRDS